MKHEAQKKTTCYTYHIRFNSTFLMETNKHQIPYNQPLSKHDHATDRCKPEQTFKHCEPFSSQRQLLNYAAR